MKSRPQLKQSVGLVGETWLALYWWKQITTLKIWAPQVTTNELVAERDTYVVSVLPWDNILKKKKLKKTIMVYMWRVCFYVHIYVQLRLGVCIFQNHAF